MSFAEIKHGLDWGYYALLRAFHSHRVDEGDISECCIYIPCTHRLGSVQPLGLFSLLFLRFQSEKVSSVLSKDKRVCVRVKERERERVCVVYSVCAVMCFSVT